jgi:hypothetical protein
VTEIGELAFRWCENLKNIRLSNNLKILQEQLFSGCKALKKVEVPASVKKIQGTALGWTKNLEVLILNDGLKELNDDLNFTKIKKLYIPKTVKKIESGLPILCRAKINKIEFEVDEKSPYFCTINGSLYSKDKTRLVSVYPNHNKKFVVPEGVQIIEQFVFKELDLEQIILPNTLTTIRHRCFENCKEIQKIILPESLTSIDYRAFDNCENLNKITCLAMEPPAITDLISIGWRNFLEKSDRVVFVPKESLIKYRKADGWKDVKHLESVEK